MPPTTRRRDDRRAAAARRRALDKAAKAGALPKQPAGPPDRVRHPVDAGQDPAACRWKQAAYLAIAEHIAYVNPRVAAFSQYLISDDPPRASGYKYGGFESGLRGADGKAKPAYEGFRLPLAVEGYGTRTCCGASCARSAR